MEEKRKDATTPPLENIPASASEPPVSEPPPPRRGRGPGQKRKASAIGGGNTSASPTTSSKRQAREKSPSNPFLPIHNGPLTRARQQPSIAAAATTSPPSVSAVKDTAVAPQPDAAAVKAKEAKEAWEALEAKIEAAYEVIKSRDANSHVVPTHAGWFSWTKLHQLEERMLPSFFNGKSENRTREIYKEIRDWIMKKYHSNPTTQIELKDLSELSVGDEEAKQEVMEFLDYWGLINFHPFPQTNSTPMSIETDADADNNDNDIDKDSKEKSLIESLFRFEKEEFFVPIVPSSNLATPSLPSGLFPESAINEELVKSEGQGVEYHCNSCSGDCSRKRYHCQKQADFDLCSECFNNGKFGSDMSPSDFILMEPGESGGASGGKWTDQETLLLLEALELYKENWTEIAEHVATKTKSQCILHFIEMPIEDTFLDSDDVTEAPPPSNNNETSASKDGPSKITEVKEGTNENQPLSSPIETSKPENGNKSKDMVEESESFAVKALKEAFEGVGYLPSPKEKLSFADASNPVMTLASFLVRLVEPNTTTASVHGSLKSISEHSAGEHLAARHCFFLEDPPDENESVTIEMAEQGDQKDEEDQNKSTQIEEVEEKSESVTDDKQNEEKLTPVTDESNEKDKDKDPVSEKDEVVLLSTDKSDPMKDSNGAEPSNVSESENHELASEQISDTTAIGETTQPAEASKDEDMISETETGQLNTSNPVVVEKAKGIEEAKDEKKYAKKETSLDKLKHAAVTALSAAAVKAKILAKEEEDQIRKLSALLIEKQLNKLETKLAFFNEMDSVVMKVREQFERSKQKLYHERAQIIATRLGMGGGPQLRPQSVAVGNRVGGNSAPRPPLSSGSALRPPGSGSGSRTMMGSPPVAGTSVQTGDQEKLSSVTTTK